MVPAALVALNQRNTSAGSLIAPLLSRSRIRQMASAVRSAMRKLDWARAGIAAGTVNAKPARTIARIGGLRSDGMMKIPPREVSRHPPSAYRRRARDGREFSHQQE